MGSLRRTTTIVYLALAACMLLAGIAYGSTRGHVASVPVSQAPRVCFAAGQWGPASDGLRPCVRVTRLYEDGSFHFAVSDANGTVRYDGGVGALDR